MRPTIAHLLRLLALTLAILPATGGAAGTDRPNIVVFLVDDMGWGDLACYGNPVIQSPNLDRFATEGVRFTQCYSACGVCSPVPRGHPHRPHALPQRRLALDPGRAFHPLARKRNHTARAAQGERLRTCHVGKWHLNGKFNSDAQPQPDDHGYDHWMATQNNASPSHKNPNNFVRNGEPVGPLEGFSAPLVAAGSGALAEGRSRSREALPPLGVDPRAPPPDRIRRGIHGALRQHR